MADTKTELVPNKPSDSLAVAPSFIERTQETGAEHLTREDIQMPRLALAQMMSPELVKSDPKYIEGLDFGTLFNNLTQTIYGSAVECCVVRADPPRYIQFAPDGKSIVDMNVPANDVRTQFGPKGEKPVAQKFYNYVLMLLPSHELIALSLKSTGIKMAKQLNGLIAARGNVKLFAGKYLIGTSIQTNSMGRFAVYTLKNAGWVDQQTYGLANEAFEALRGKVINIEHDADDSAGGDDSFDTAAMDKQSGGVGGM